MEDNKERIVVGLDIGTTKICAIAGRRNEYGKLEILGMGKAESEGVMRGVVTNIDKTIRAIQKAIAEAEEQTNLNIQVVNVGIAGQHIRSSIHHNGITRKNSDTEITVEDVARLTEEMFRIVIPPGNDIIHVMPQDYTVDYEGGIKDPVGMQGAKLEADFHVITAKTNDIKNINKCVMRSDLEIENLILEPLASSLSVLSDEEKEAGVCLVDIGGGTTDVAIFHDNIIRHTAVIPFGGNIITSDIKQGCMVLTHQAESLKTKFGMAIAEEAKENEIITIPGLRNRPPKEISVKNLACIIEARMEEIIELVHAEIITAGYEGKLSGGIVLTGGGAQLSCVKQLVEYVTGMDARIGYPNEHLGKSSGELKSPMYATAIGLVLSGFMALDDREERYNQMQPDGRKRSPRDNGGFFKKIMEKTKLLLVDDLDSKEY